MTTWVPLWKKVRIELDSAAENILGKKKSVIELPKSMEEKRDGFYSATVVAFDPLAGTDAKSGIRYHDFKIGEKILVNRTHVQKVLYQGQTINLIQDIFIMAYEADAQPIKEAVPLAPEDQYVDGEQPSTIYDLEEQELTSD
jgi:co-chaperonin GroES (HSP10)